MSINKIQIFESTNPLPSDNAILLSISDNAESNCTILPGHDGFSSLVDLKISRAVDVSAVLGDLLSSFDFDMVEYVLMIKSQSRHVCASDVAFLLSALYPGVPIETELCESVSGFVVNNRPICTKPVQEHTYV